MAVVQLAGHPRVAVRVRVLHRQRYLVDDLVVPVHLDDAGVAGISQQRVASVADHLKEGQLVKVKVLEADDKGRLRLSMKAVEVEQPGAAQPS